MAEQAVFRIRPSDAGVQELPSRQGRTATVINKIHAAKNLDVDRHALALRRGGCAGGEVGRRTPLILMVRQAEAPGGNVDFLEWRIDGSGEARLDDDVLFHFREPRIRLGEYRGGLQQTLRAQAPFRE